MPKEWLYSDAGGAASPRSALSKGDAHSLCPPARLPAADLDHVLAHTRGLWESVRDGRIFATGGTGFFGAWLVESFVHANARLGLHAKLCVLSRDPRRFLARLPHLSGESALEFHSGDVRDFAFPAGRYTHVIHAAVESSTRVNAADPLRMVDVIVQGTRRTLDFARQAGVERFLLVSSGAVYGAQPPEMPALCEDFGGTPLAGDVRSAYAQAKRTAELLATLAARQFALHVSTARCFAFVGPHLPLDEHFAIGNFLGDALAGRPIVVQGDGLPVRSYLYAADLTVWLWTILFRGRTEQTYNVGSDAAYTLGEVARHVAALADPPREVTIRQAARATVDRYLPDVSRARNELGLTVRIGLEEALARTAAWHRGNRMVDDTRARPAFRGRERTVHYQGQ